MDSTVEGEFDDAYHYRTFVENQDRNESFELQFYSTTDSDFEPTCHYRRLAENPEQNESP